MKICAFDDAPELVPGESHKFPEDCSTIICGSHYELIYTYPPDDEECPGVDQSGNQANNTESHKENPL